MNPRYLDQKSATRTAVPPSIVRESVTQRTAIVVSADRGLRDRLKKSLTGLRWQVQEAAGGAEALDHIESLRPEAVLLDSWLPDLEVDEVAGHVRTLYPAVDIVRLDGGNDIGGVRSPRRHELMHALREAQSDGPGGTPPASELPRMIGLRPASPEPAAEQAAQAEAPVRPSPVLIGRNDAAFIPEMVGHSQPMQELARLIRLVAPRSATVLIEGETGTGKEVVAKALHRLSTRSAKSFVVLNCAAIPETLLEAELFGHTRGAFTGAEKARMGRIEAAHGGTLFLDEIGEMPFALQAKMLRFLESGELQKVGENEAIRVDVRVIAATHQPLERRAEEHTFRLDLYHRLAVFPIEVPALRDRTEDIALLVEHFLEIMGRDSPRKRIAPTAMQLLEEHDWPGNVRELMHVVERAAILVGDHPEIGPNEIRLRREGR